MSTVYFDCETHLITPTNPVPRLVCLQYAIDDGPVVIARSPAPVHEWLARGDRMVAHNGFFDWSVILFDRPEVAPRHEDVWAAMEDGRIQDTLVLGALHAIEYDWMRANPPDNWAPADLSLAGLEKTFLDRATLDKSGDTYRLRYAELEDIPTEEWPAPALDYARRDVTVLRDIHRALRATGWFSADEARQTLAHWCLRLMEVTGITTSPRALERLLDVCEPALERARPFLLREGLLRPGTSKVDTERQQAVIEKVAAERGITVPRTPSGRFSTTAAVMASLGLPPARDPSWLGPPSPPTKDMAAIRARVETFFGGPEFAPTTDKGATSTERAVLEVVGEKDPAVAVLAEVGAVEKVMSTYVPVFRQPVSHPRWHGLKETGRVSVSRPNLNNIPRELRVGSERHGIVRQCFVARPGHVFVDADYTQAELCALAQVTYEMFGYSHMRDAIVAGRDLHKVFGAQLAGVSYEEFDRRYSAEDRDAKDLRTLAKAANFGYPGGLGPRKFVDFAREMYKVVLTMDRARELKREWLDAFPEVAAMFAWVNDRLSYSPTFTLEQIRSGRRRGGCGYCDGANSLFQGLTADGAKRALALITRECYLDRRSPLFGSRPVAFIYDEFLLEVPEAQCHDAATRLVELMIEGMRWATPDVPVAATVEAMYHWTKDIKARWDSNGRLIPSDERM